jgi:hypothetical protein
MKLDCSGSRASAVSSCDFPEMVAGSPMASPGSALRITNGFPSAELAGQLHATVANEKHTQGFMTLDKKNCTLGIRCRR